MAKIWDAMGVDYINVNCGLQATSFYNREPPSFKQGWKRNLATSVKAVVKCPVIAVNTVKKPDFAESLLEDGVSDFVGLTRGHIATPAGCRKWQRAARMRSVSASAASTACTPQCREFSRPVR